MCFDHFDFQICFAPEQPAIFDLSSRQMAQHPPHLSAFRNHFSTEVEMEKKCTLLWRSTFQSKMLKTCGFCSKCKHDGRLEGSAKMHFAWQARYERHLQQTCPEVSLEGLHFGAVCQDDFEWQVQHFVWPGLTFSWQPHYCTSERWQQKSANRTVTVASKLSVTCQICRKSRRKVYNVQIWRKSDLSLAEKFCFSAFNFQTGPKSRRIALF